MTSFYLPLAAVLSLAAALPAVGQQALATQRSTALDATWTRTFAVPWADRPTDPQAVNPLGEENRLNNDPRFAALLRSSFRQQQWFLSVHSKYTRIADLVKTFIGVPGNAILDDNRYVTADGCMPHTCDIFRGMLWIDTAARPATLIFAATDTIDSVDYTKQIYQDQIHLWLFVSNNSRSPATLPPEFLFSLKRWHDVNEANGYKQDIALVTIVQPDGGQLDLTYSNLFAQRAAPRSKK